MLYNPEIMANPEARLVVVEGWGKPTEIQIREPESLRLSFLKDVVEDQILTGDREIVGKRNDEEEILMDGDMCNELRRRFNFGCPIDDAILAIALSTTSTDRIIIRDRIPKPQDLPLTE
jgi:hypothetical protein